MDEPEVENWTQLLARWSDEQRAARARGCTWLSLFLSALAAATAPLAALLDAAVGEPYAKLPLWVLLVAAAVLVVRAWFAHEDAGPASRDTRVWIVVAAAAVAVSVTTVILARSLS